MNTVCFENIRLVKVPFNYSVKEQCCKVQTPPKLDALIDLRETLEP